MEAKRVRVPQVVHHKASDRDVVFLRQPDGSRAMVYLGPHDSAEAVRRYRQVLADHLAGRPLEVVKRKELPSQWPTVGQLVAAFLLHCERYYVDAAGVRSKGVVNILHAMEPFLALLRDKRTDSLGVVALDDVQQSIVVGGTCNRGTINNKMRRIRQCVRWGVGRKMVPGSVWHEVSAMKGIPAGRGGVREPKVVTAVPRAWVDAVLPHLTRPLAAAVELQWWCGARPSEVLQLTRARIEFGEDGWTFRPSSHKGNWLGRDRRIVLGPKAREILTPMLKLQPDAAILSPRDALAEISERKAMARKSKETPSQRERRARNAAKEPTVGEFYNVNAYRKAIHRACDDAGIPRWSPHRLRHAAGTRLYLAAGIEASRVALGHTDDRVTRRYAVGADSELAKAVMGQHG